MLIACVDVLKLVGNVEGATETGASLLAKSWYVPGVA